VPQIDLLATLKGNPRVKVEVKDPLGTQGWLRPNHLHPPFDNPKARQALLHIVNQADYMRSVIGDETLWTECPAYFMCGSPLESTVGSEALMGQDMEAAKKLLAEAGYKGEAIILMDPTDVPVLHNASLVTAQLLREAGMKVEVQAMDWSTLTSRRAKKEPVDEGGWNIFHTWWIGGDITNPVVATGMSGGGVDRAWFGWPDDPELEEMRSAFAREIDAGKQKELADKIQAKAIDTVTHGNVGTFFVPVAYRDNVKGLIKSPVQFFWNIDVER